MTQFKVTLEREGCIGAAACVAAFEKLWDIDEEGKAKIIMGGGKRLENGDWEIILEEKDLAQALESAQVCPVNVIHIENLDTKEKII